MKKLIRRSPLPKIENQRFNKRKPLIALLLALSAALGSPYSSLAVDAGWKTTPGSNDFNDGANWTAGVVPTATASFSDSNVSNPTITGVNITLGSITFTSAASAFTINVSDSAGGSGTLIINGTGVANNSGTTQNFQINVANFASTNIIFKNSASASNGTGNIVYTTNNDLRFDDSSTAGTATIIAQTVNAAVSFTGTSTAGHANVTASAGSQVYFYDDSSGGQASFVINGTSSMDISHHNSGTVSMGSVYGAGDIYLGSNNLTAGDDSSGTFSGAIHDGALPLSGPPTGTGIGGSFTKTGTGALTLSGSSDYTGGTTLNAGSLFVDNTNALGTGTLNLHGGTFASNTGGLHIANALAVTGDFNIAPASGGLYLDGNVDLGGTTHTITNTTTQNSSFTAYFSGVISGSAGVTFEAPNIGYFQYDGTSANTYTGTTTVQNRATLNLNKSPGVNAIVGTLVINSGGNVQIEQANQIADTAAVIMNGGEFNLIGSPETIGSLNGSGDILLSTSGILTVTSGSYSGIMEDNGSAGNFTKSGVGTFILSGSNSYTGTTTVNGGLLQIDGTTQSAVTVVNAGGTLGGTGRIGGNLINNGNVAPGDSPGTLTVVGNYLPSASGTTTIQIGGIATGQHDLLAVGGSATLDGKLQLLRLNNFAIHAGDKIVFLTTGGTVSGTFATVDTDTIMDAKIVYELQDVALEFKVGSFSSLQGLTPNQTAVAKNLDTAVSDPRATGLISFLANEPLGNLPADLDLIAPDELTAIFEISRSFADVQGSNIEGRLADVRHENSDGVTVLAFRSDKDTVPLRSEDGKQVETNSTRAGDQWDIFLAGSGDFVRLQGDGNAPGYNFNTGGVTVGADYRVNEHFVIGVMGGYADTGATLSQGGSVDVNSGKLGIYSTLYSQGFYLNAMATGGYNSYDTHRTALGGIASGNTEGTEFDGLLGAGYDVHAGNFTLGPVASAQYTYVSINSYTEAGSLAPLNIASQNQDSFRTKVGFTLAYNWKMENGVVVTPSLTASWQHEYLSSSFALDSSFASGAGGVFTVHGPQTGRDAAVVNAGVSIQWTPRFGTYLYYDGELGRKNYQLNSVSGGVKLGF